MMSENQGIDRDAGTPGKGPAQGRSDRVTRTILASPHMLFRAFIDKEIMAAWRTPDEMSTRFESFEPRIGGGYHMVLRYEGDDSAKQGKTRPGEDEVIVTFLELLPDERIVEAVEFVSDNPALQGRMTLTTTFTPVKDGTKVVMQAENVSSGISARDHKDGMTSALRNLARLTE